MSRILSVVVAFSLLSVAAPTQAQADWNRHYNQGHGYGVPSWWSQRDRPGDYRCDAYWDANRTDCHARWRDQGPYRTAYGYGRSYSHGRVAYDYNRYAHAVRAGGDAWNGAYGRPDIVYPGSGHARDGYGARDPRRVDWCRWNYRSYNPATGYYRAYSGRLVYCG